MGCGSTVISGKTYDVVYVGRGLIWQRIIGLAGKEWESLGRFEDPSAGIFYGHADQHALATNPLNSFALLAGCDGGVCELVYDGSTDNVQMKSLNDDLAITNVTRLHARQMGPGAWREPRTLAPRSWCLVAQWGQRRTGDGGACAINPANPLIQYCTGDYNGVFRRTADGWVTYLANGSAPGSYGGCQAS